jgi:hypothetical protein
MGGIAMKQSLYLVILTILLLFFCVESSGAPADSTVVNAPGGWSLGGAQTLPAGRWETGLFQPLRYGYTQSLELETHPILFFIMPNFSVKWKQAEWNRFRMASRHTIIYPTLLLRTLAREGSGGIISPEFHIPHLLAIYNEIILTGEVLPAIMLTGKAGVEFSIKSGKLDSRTTIDLPMAFPRMQAYYHNYGFRAGMDIQAGLAKHWQVEADALFFLSPPAEEQFAFEHKMLLSWLKSAQWQFNLGYKLVYGQYPFGNQWHLFVPIFDLLYAW